MSPEKQLTEKESSWRQGPEMGKSWTVLTTQSLHTMKNKSVRQMLTSPKVTPFAGDLGLRVSMFSCTLFPKYIHGQFSLSRTMHTNLLRTFSLFFYDWIWLTSSFASRSLPTFSFSIPHTSRKNKGWVFLFLSISSWSSKCLQPATYYLELHCSR